MNLVPNSAFPAEPTSGFITGLMLRRGDVFDKMNGVKYCRRMTMRCMRPVGASSTQSHKTLLRRLWKVGDEVRGLWLENWEMNPASSRRLLLENSPPPMFMLLSANWKNSIPTTRDSSSRAGQPHPQQTETTS